MKTNLSVKKLRDTVNRAYNSPENIKNRKKMNEYMKIYSGELWDESNLNEYESRIQVNYLFSTIVTIAPMLTDNRPIWGVHARQYYMQRMADLYGIALEYFWDKEEIDTKIYECVLDALIMKIGIFKVFYDWENGVFGDVGLEVVDPRTFIIAPGYTDPWEAPWCGEKLRKPMSWVKEQFPDEWRNIKPDNDEKISDFHEDIELTDKMTTIYIIWLKDDSIEEYIEGAEKTIENEMGIKAKVTEKVKTTRKKYPNGRIVYFANGFDKFLKDEPSPFNHGKAPYVTLYDYRMPHEFMGMCEGDQLLSLHKEANMAWQKIAGYVRKWATPNFSAETNTNIDPEKFKQLAPGGDNLFMRAPGSKTPEAIEIPPINRTVMDFLYSIPTAMEEVSGVTDITKGMAEKKQRQSAQEIATLAETSYTRTRQRVRNLEHSIKRLCYLIICMMQQYYSEIRSINVKREGTVDYREISNSKNFVSATLKPPEGFASQNPEEQDEYDNMVEDYQKFIENFGEVDYVYADFDVTIETNSTLPLDKQSLANLYLRLANIQLSPQSAIDVKSLLEGLKIPQRKKIIERLQKAMNQQAPQPAMAGAGV